MKLNPISLGLSLALFAPTLWAIPSPRSGRWQLSLPVEVVWHLDPGYEVFRRSHTGSPGLMLSRDLSPVDNRLALAVDLGYRRENLSTTFANSLSAELNTDFLSAGFSLRYTLFRFIEPYARLSAGAAHTRMVLRSSQSLEDTQWMPFGGLGVGVMARSAALAPGSGFGRLGLTFSLEGGVLVAPNVSYSVAPPKAPDDAAALDQIPVRATQVGTLNASGPYFRAVFGLRF